MARLANKRLLKTPAAKQKIDRVFSEAKKGTLRTSAGGRPVSRDQVTAIALSEGERAAKRKRK